MDLKQTKETKKDVNQTLPFSFPNTKVLSNTIPSNVLYSCIFDFQLKKATFLYRTFHPCVVLLNR